MKTVDEHISDILGAVAVLPARRLPLPTVHGCVLAANVRATIALPGFDNSAMDGYAVRAADVATASEDAPVRLPVAGEIAAGAALPPEVAPGTAVRIMTGAPFPPGADTVVQVEWTDGGTETVAVHRPAERGLHIRRKGEEVAIGDLVLTAGTMLGAAQIGLLAAVNVANPPVHPRPRLAVLSTGSELVDVGGRVGPGQIVDSNSHAVVAAAREAGAEARRLTGVPDDPERFEEALRSVLPEVDAIVTTGGVSVGAHDIVKEVLTATGEVRFERIAMQPGKPQGFGVIDGVPVFTLPGNPVSALVSFELFVRPALRRMRGLTGSGRPRVTVTVAEALRSPAGKRSFPRVRVTRGEDGGLLAYSAGGQGSHHLAAAAGANALLVVPEDVTEVEAGKPATAILLAADPTDGDLAAAVL
ncbi:molybdopterin molybdotransferase MoeA [Frankia sp. CNm7]|uniref:Molybdopterin molybdenumtransferase n=1 Tax=Frankia nepalensis TaxID=1836974 RepID=A0A937UQD3_9ACTN|nr:gephyrin-like molybdotransferase Glp [Frankia nepalensis]MBL7494793.1 molybdopterin molybdotransferase MoeA [Frankia nepalensis]MBL7514333.1 molybdopterin molybdotransferase MoeA [Frankia nepalensis]MBL7517250.1 molybdopterin molybdotransferase MoeA [Frankia nepalensis]MBL7631739.1 molybdopterin molybdotransferase MoeA [Frankia nepalensis]